MDRLRRQSALLPLLLAALLLRGLLPLGYMPSSSSGLAFCTPAGLQKTLAEAAVPGADSHQECPYGFALGMGALPVSAEPEDFSHDGGTAKPVVAAAAPRSASGPPFAARGPPSLV